MERANDELVRAAREQQQAQRHAMLELGRQQQALAEERGQIQAERERDAHTVAHATLNREQLAEAKEQLALKEEELLRLRTELQTMSVKLPVLTQERLGLLARLSAKDDELCEAHERLESLGAQIAQTETLAAARQVRYM